MFGEKEKQFLFTITLRESRIKMHWSVLLLLIPALFAIPSVLIIIISILTGIALVVIHEFGHYFIAKRLKYNVDAIVVHFMGGYCDTDEAYSQREAALLASGGVLAQIIPLIAALGLLLGLRLVDAPMNRYIRYLLVSRMVIYNLIMVLFNLVPLKGFDGIEIFEYIKSKFGRNKIARRSELPSKGKEIKKKIRTKHTKEEIKQLADRLIEESLRKVKEEKENT